MQLIQAMLHYKVDLVVIEGMGRALHTNLQAKFKCDCLKLAVIKNRWLAQRLGGDIFSVLCKFEPAPSKMYVSEEPDCPIVKPLSHAKAMEAR